MVNLTHDQYRIIVGLAIGLFSILSLLLLEIHFKPLAKEGLYFQKWSSETMMQTVSIEDLRDEPFRTLWYLHIQPPVLDGIRALMAFFWRSDDSGLMLRHVDSSIYILWAVIYGMMGFVLFWWLSEMTSIIFSVITSLFFMAHPACILYATLLDTTFLSAFLTLCFFYFLWRIKEGMNVSVPLLVISFLMLFFTRSIYQWPWLLLLPLSLILMRYPFRKMVLFICITGLIVGLYTTKQMYLFHLTSNSFTGFNLCNSIGIGVNYASYAELADPLQIPDPEKPKAITRLKKIDGSINYNNELYLLQSETAAGLLQYDPTSNPEVSA